MPQTSIIWGFGCLFSEMFIRVTLKSGVVEDYWKVRYDENTTQFWLLIFPSTHDSECFCERRGRIKAVDE
jgi:hypothetical protein